jgi:hypothetical protein
MPAKPTGAFKPGALAPVSGFVQTPGVEGEKTVIRGRRFPPTSQPGQVYVYTAVPLRGTTRVLAHEETVAPETATLDRRAA